MKIVLSNNFSTSLDIILDYISKDDIKVAIQFNKALKKAIKSIPNFPYKSRKSIYHSDDNIRDFIFKGYTISYLVDNNKIVLLDIFKWMNK